MDETHNDELMAKARGLAKNVTPERDLWPGIEAAIREPQRSWWTPTLAQAAAVLLLVGASSTMTYILVKEDPQIIEVSRPTLETEFVALVSPATLGDDYRLARGAVVRQLDLQLERLPAETREDVERNLAVIRQAINDINTALSDAPDNRLLQDLLVNAYREELSVMQRVGTLTNQVMSRQDI